MNISDLKNYTVLPSGSSSSGNTQSQEPISLGQKVLNTATNISNFAGAKGVTDEFGATAARALAPKNQKEFVDFPTSKEVFGSAVQTGANFIPGAGEGLNLLGKVAVGAGTGYLAQTGANLQDPNKTTGQAFAPGVVPAITGGLPIAGKIIKPATAIIGRLLKGLGSGLSGVSSETIDKIVNNPESALKASQKLAASGNNRVLEENAKTIINGISKIHNEASSAYRNGLDKLSSIDIKPENLKQGFFSALEKNKIAVSAEGKIDFSNADFLDPKVQQKAESIINKINSQDDLSGTGIRKLMDTVDNSRFKSAPDGDRQAFNAFISDIKDGLKEGINSSTDKLAEINKKYSADMQLSEATQNIFGNVNFKNLPEVVKASQKLEGLFSQKGLAPEVVDNFLKRVGVNPADFKTSEAVRQISNKEATANSVGTSFGEVVRSATSAVITPKMVRDLSIVTGLAKETLIPFLKKMKPVARDILINALIRGSETSSQQNQSQ